MDTINRTPATLTIVVVSYNTANLLAACLESVQREARANAGLDVVVVVVDNGSSDDSVAVARDLGVHVVELGRNVGFAEACNTGAAATSSDLLLFLNPDAVMRAGCLAALIASARANPGAGIIGGRAFRPDGSVDPGSAMGRVTLWSMVCFATGLSTFRSLSRLFNPEALVGLSMTEESEVGTVSGSLLLIARPLWDQLGGFSSRFFMYGEDADLAFRARAAGFSPRITPVARIEHVGGASSSSAAKWVMLMRGKVTILEETWPTRYVPIGKALLLIGTWLRARLSNRVDAAAPWGATWASRAQWRDGWTAVNDPRVAQRTAGSS